MGSIAGRRRLLRSALAGGWRPVLEHLSRADLDELRRRIGDRRHDLLLRGLR